MDKMFFEIHSVLVNVQTIVSPSELIYANQIGYICYSFSLYLRMITETETT